MMDASGNLAVYGYPSGSGYTTSENYDDNTWHKSIVVMSNGSIKIFVDRIKILDINANPITSFLGFFSIGATKAKGSFSGQLKNFKVWNFNLSDEQAVSLS